MCNEDLRATGECLSKCSKWGSSKPRNTTRHLAWRSCTLCATPRWSHGTVPAGLVPEGGPGAHHSTSGCLRASFSSDALSNTL
eukprot:794327-Amphidinium_carterae.2